MNPDDMLLHPNVLNKLYNYNKKYNLEIIEYTVYHYKEKERKLFKNNQYLHYHNFLKNIIYQPDLSNLLIYCSGIKIIQVLYVKLYGIK